MRNLYLTDRFFTILGSIVVFFVVAFLWSPLYPLGIVIFILLCAIVLVDIFLLFGSNVNLYVHRSLPKIFSNGDPNKVVLFIHNRSNIDLELTVIEELPIQFQIRDFEKVQLVKAGYKEELVYELRPTERGEYIFGYTNVFAKSKLGLVERSFQLSEPSEIAVYPSIIQMKHYGLMAVDRLMQFNGIKKIRRIGHSYEFEQIKNYVRGDDYRSINWKASGRRGLLMVNQYEDERAQQVYSVIDKSRVMKMPFEGLSLMDYAINSSLVISNIALQKHDRAGLLTFSDKLGTFLKADSQTVQLNKILQSLYKESERSLDANYELLYYAARKLINGRSLLLLYTNFESDYALERVLPILRKINKFHLLVVIFFENTEISAHITENAENVEQIYHQTIARKYYTEKYQMVHKLKQFGIQAVFSKPEELSINTINKYLELKAKGLI